MKKNWVHICIGTLACCMFITGCGERQGETYPQTAVTPAAEQTITPQVTEAEITKVPEVISTPIPTEKQTKEPETKQPVTKEPQSTPKSTKKAEEEKISFSNMEHMDQLLTTIACYMEEGGSYNVSEESSYYDIMYLLANNMAYLYGNELYKETEASIYIDETAMQDLSETAFAGHSTIGEIPKEYNDVLSYNAEKSVYVVMASDGPDITGELIDAKEIEDGSYIVVLALTDIETGEEAGQYEFVLEKHKQSSDELPELFKFSVKDVICLN